MHGAIYQLNVAIAIAIAILHTGHPAHLEAKVARSQLACFSACVLKQCIQFIPASDGRKGGYI